MEQRDTFDAVAELYGEARPGYPAALFEDLATRCGLSSTSTVLEVGCGAGQATGDLAARAARVVAVDPGPRLIEEARRRVTSDNVAFTVAHFEDFEPEPGGFDFVVSAQAWHWVDPVAGFPLAARALKANGVLAIFGHVPLLPVEPHLSAFKQIYEAQLPGAWGTPSSETAYQPSGPFAAMIDQSGLFGAVTHRSYNWTWPVDPQTLGRFLRTDSSYLGIPEAQRFALFDALSTAIEDLGGVMESRWETHLYVATRR
jgi:SAM-dependent methyltransferase